MVTQRKDSRLVELAPIEWEEFKKAFVESYFPCYKRMFNVKEFKNLRQGNMIVEEYSLKFTLLSKFAPSLVSNPSDQITRFLTGVSDLLKESVVRQCYMVI